MNLSPIMMLAQLRSAAAYAFGRGQPADLFVIDRPSFWQAIWGGWIIHIVATSFATTFISPLTFAKISLVHWSLRSAMCCLCHFDEAD